MQKSLFGEAPPLTQLILALFTIIASSVFFLFIGILFAPLILGISPAQLVAMMGNGEAVQDINILRYLQTLQNISHFVIPAFFIGYLFSGNAISYFNLSYMPSGKWFGVALLIMLAIVPFINLLASLNEMIVFPESLSWLEQKFRTMEDSAAQLLTKLLTDADHIGWLFFNIFMIAVLPAIGEELIFRGVAQKIFIRWTGSVHAGIIVTAFLFSFIHMQFYGFFPRWLLGAMFGYMLVWSGSIWVPVFAHFVFNSVAVIAAYLIEQGYVSEKIESYGSEWNAAPVTVILTGMCVLLSWRMYKENNVKTN